MSSLACGQQGQRSGVPIPKGRRDWLPLAAPSATPAMLHQSRLPSTFPSHHVAWPAPALASRPALGSAGKCKCPLGFFARGTWLPGQECLFVGMSRHLPFPGWVPSWPSCRLFIGRPEPPLASLPPSPSFLPYPASRSLWISNLELTSSLVCAGSFGSVPFFFDRTDHRQRQPQVLHRFSHLHHRPAGSPPRSSI